MAAQFVSPYRKSGKNDANDAEAICEAVGRTTMRFVPVKTEEAQAVLTLHRAREYWFQNALRYQIRSAACKASLALPLRAAWRECFA